MLRMADLEWPLCTPPRFVHLVTPLATSARHSAWRISRGEAQFAQTTKHILHRSRLSRWLLVHVVLHDRTPLLDWQQPE